MNRLALVGGGLGPVCLQICLPSDRARRSSWAMPEATALGNAVVQGIALGRFARSRWSRPDGWPHGRAEVA